MNILICHPPWVTETSGVGAVVRMLREHLARAGHRVVLFTAGTHGRLTHISEGSLPTYSMELRVPIVARRPWRSRLGFALGLPGTVLRIARFLREQRIDVVNVHYPLESDLYFGMCRCLRAGGSRLVASIHGADVLPMPGAPPDRCPGLGFLLETADAVVAPSRAFLDESAQYFPQVERRGVVIPNGIALADFQAGDPPSTGAHVLCVAMHNKKKGLDTLLRAFARLAPQQPDVRLRLVGDGPLRTELEHLASALGVAERVDFLGVQGREAVVRLVREARVIVLPSRAEPFGIALLEGMACGKPVVATRTGGIPEIVEDGVTGLLVPPDDEQALAGALLRVLGDPFLAARLGRAGAEAVRVRFTDAVTGASYLALFEDLLTRRSIMRSDSCLGMTRT